MKLFVKMRFLASLLDFIYSYHSGFPSRTEFRVMLLYILYESVMHCYTYLNGVIYSGSKLCELINTIYETA